jgi:hypothetical protein
MADETTPAAVAAPAQAAQAAPAPEGRVPHYRLNDEIGKRNEAIASRDAALSKVAELEAALGVAQTGLQKLQTTSTQEMHLLGLGFKADSVRRFFRREYTAAAAEAGDAAPKFADWLEASKSDPLYAVHFTGLTPDTAPAQATDAPAAPAAVSDQERMVAAVRAAILGNPDAGAGQPPTSTAKEWTVEDIRRERAKNGGQLGSSSDQMIEQLRAKGLIK